MIDWLFETFVWTAALIALVLVLRRPVARWFGPQMAYALWALPAIRLVLPPVVLPAWMNPDPIEIEPAIEVVPFISDDVVYYEPVHLSEPVATSWLDTLPLTEIALALWLTGAAYFLFMQFRGYAMMREDMLDGAKSVGRHGKIRLIETPATSAPLAFGITDKVVALPIGFMAQYDRELRDLALEHELAHHHGQDLLVNFLVQPLFALHWFNPLGRLGWLALRRDQEAACDARVVQARHPQERATYANVIASFAAGPNVALAAPMACPVLGDKSIIHRLRSLKMSDLSNRRRMAGRGMILAALVALPMTASITYAESAMPAPPAPREAPAAPLAPNAPEAPLPPLPPLAPLAPLSMQASADVDEAPEVVEEVHVHRDVVKDKDGKTEKKVHRKVIIKGDEHMTAEERAELRRELHESMAEMDDEIREAMEEAREALAESRVAMMELRDGKHGVTSVSIKCKDGSKGTELRDSDGKSVTRLCTSEIMADALNGLKEARAAIAKDKELSADIRAEILKSLDARIADWNNS